MGDFISRRLNLILFPSSFIWGVIFFSLSFIPNYSKGAELYPYATHTSILVRTDDGQQVLSLSEPLIVYGQEYNNAYVVTNGAISFADSQHRTTGVMRNFPLSVGPIIAPMWTDVDISKNGTLLYRQTTSASETQQFTDTIATLDSDFNTDWALVVTWNEVSGYGIANELWNSFQAVIASDLSRRKTYTIFIYRDLEWFKTTLEIGVDAGNSENYKHLPDVDYQNLETELLQNSNVGLAGIYVLRIDQSPGCRSGWDTDPDSGVCIKVMKRQRKTFNNARAECVRLGGDLATSVWSRAQRKRISGAIKFSGHIWIGVKDLDGTGTYSYINASPVISPPFKRGRPSSKPGERFCVSLKKGRWFDKKCSKALFFVCQMDPY